jgi:hypothetical protein
MLAQLDTGYLGAAVGVRAENGRLPGFLAARARCNCSVEVDATWACGSSSSAAAESLPRNSRWLTARLLSPTRGQAGLAAAAFDVRSSTSPRPAAARRLSCSFLMSSSWGRRARGFATSERRLLLERLLAPGHPCLQLVAHTPIEAQARVEIAGLKVAKRVDRPYVAGRGRISQGQAPPDHRLRCCRHHGRFSRAGLCSGFVMPMVSCTTYDASTLSFVIFTHTPTAATSSTLARAAQYPRRSWGDDLLCASRALLTSYDPYHS